jgi:hypothetical protein
MLCGFSLALDYKVPSLARPFSDAPCCLAPLSYSPCGLRVSAHVGSTLTTRGFQDRYRFRVDDYRAGCVSLHARNCARFRDVGMLKFQGSPPLLPV